MKPKQLSEEQFHEALSRLKFQRNNNTKDIAYGVLVRGLPQSHFVRQLNLTRGAVSLAVRRVWAAHLSALPTGYERVTAVLPQEQASIVKEWARVTASRLEMEPQ